MITTIFISLLIMNVVANETQQDKSREKISDAHNLKSVKKSSKEFVKNISSKISKNRLLMSHILLRNSLNTNFTKADLFDDDISIKERDELMKDIMKSTSEDMRNSVNGNETQLKIPHLISGNVLLNSLQRPIYPPIPFQRIIPMPISNPFAMNYPFGGNMLYQRPPICFINPQNYPNICCISSNVCMYKFIL